MGQLALLPFGSANIRALRSAESGQFHRHVGKVDGAEAIRPSLVVGRWQTHCAQCWRKLLPESLGQRPTTNGQRRVLAFLNPHVSLLRLNKCTFTPKPAMNALHRCCKFRYW